MKSLMSILFIFCIFESLSAEEVDVTAFQKELDYIYSIRMHDINDAKNRIEKLSSKLSELTNYQKAQFFNLRAHSELIRGNLDKALVYASKVKNYSNNTDVVARNKVIRSSALYSSGEYQKGFIILYEALDGIDSISSAELKQSLLQNAISLHTGIEIFDKSQELARKMLANARENKNDEYNCIGFVELTTISIKLNNLPQAKTDISNSINNCSKVENNLIELIIEFYKAKILKQEGHLEEAEKVFLSQYQNLIDFGWKSMVVDVQIDLANLYLELNKFDKAKAFAEEAFDYSKSINNTRDIRNSSEVLVKYYKFINNKEDFEHFKKEYLESTNEYLLQTQRKRIAYYQAMNYRAKKKELQNKKVAVTEPF